MFTRRSVSRPVLVAMILLAGAVIFMGISTLAEGVDPFDAEVGFRGQSFAPVTAPSGDKPQSKLWFQDGVWWGALLDGRSGDVTIHRLNRKTQRWENQGTIIDERQTSHSDVLAAGDQLLVVSGGQDVSDPLDGIRFSRYTYQPDAMNYTLDPGYPVVVTWHGTESVVLAQDSTGDLWLTYAHDGAVWVSHSDSVGTTWAEPFRLPSDLATSIAPDDIASIVAFDDRGRPSVGVLFSNQNEEAFVFGIHADEHPPDHWRFEVVLQGPGIADDHINLKAIQGGRGGRVFAAVKTSLTSPGDPLLLMIHRSFDGNWDSATISTVEDQHTRPVLLLDAENRLVHVFASAPCCSGGYIYRKTTNLDIPSFDPGPGALFLAVEPDSRLNNATSTKQVLDASTDAVVVASDVTGMYYAHGVLGLDSFSLDLDTAIRRGPAPMTPEPTALFEFTATTPSATFECRVTTRAETRFTPCSSPFELRFLEPGFHRLEVRAMDEGHDDTVDTSPAIYEWHIMADAFADDFDDSLDRWDLDLRGSATAELVDTGNGSAAAFESDGSARTFVTAAIDVETTDATLIRARFRVDEDGDEGGHVRVLTLNDQNGSPVAYLYRQNASGRIWMQVGSSRLRTRGTVELAAWADFEVRLQASSTGLTEVTVQLDDRNILTAEVPMFRPTDVARLELGYRTTGQRYRILIDDLVVQS